MKNFKVKVEDREVKFFKELLDKFSFVHYEELVGSEEPRIYPAADFEIRSKKHQEDKGVKADSGEPPKRSLEKSKKNRQDAMNDIRNVISQIDKLRDSSR
ncbi:MULTISPECIES: hypothetical protein [unclassified Saccharicrinis]|uniref:hypothetical protein n=1 Tax=unclassified Saccharicrinis TaxID=2646859 RepID=UPI003D3288C0